MFMQKRNSLLLILIILPYSLYAWGSGGYKLTDGSCKFNLETGYKNTSIYTKNHKGFVIIDGGDPRYGTISTDLATLIRTQK